MTSFFWILGFLLLFAYVAGFVFVAPYFVYASRSWIGILWCFAYPIVLLREECRAFRNRRRKRKEEDEFAAIGHALSDRHFNAMQKVGLERVDDEDIAQLEEAGLIHLSFDPFETDRLMYQFTYKGDMVFRYACFKRGNLHGNGT